MQASKQAARIVLMSGLAFSSAAFGQEGEVNDTFAARHVRPYGPQVLNASLHAPGLVGGNLIFSAPGQFLTSGAVDSHVFGYSAGAPFYALIDNRASGVDTVMRSLDEFNSTIFLDDDSGPYPLGSALGGVGNADGSVRLQVSGYPDFAFDGSHTRSGAYDLLVYDNPVQMRGDIDFYEFSAGPGDVFSAEIIAGDMDSAMGFYDSSGVLITTDDDSGAGFLSRIDGVVPADGRVIIAVSGFPDFSFEGFHKEEGEYIISFIPTPSTGAAFGLLALPALRRRRTARI